MERTNITLADMARLALPLLTANTDAPTLAAVHVSFGYHPVTTRWVPRIQLQLLAVTADDESVRNVAEWARRLAGSVHFGLFDGFIHVAGWTEMGGVTIEAWNHLRPATLPAVLPAELARRAEAGESIPPQDLLAALS